MAYVVGQQVALVYNWAGSVGWKAADKTVRKKAFGPLSLAVSDLYFSIMLESIL